MKVQFKNWSCYTKAERYQLNGRLCIILLDTEDHQQVAIATVNLPEYRLKEEGIILNDDQIFVKDYSENEGMTKALIDAGVIEQTPICCVKTGYVEVSTYRLTEQAIKEFVKPNEHLT